jgi:hypothetical protein
MGVSLGSEMNQGSEYYLVCSNIIALVYFLMLSLKCVHDMSCGNFARCLYSETIMMFELFPPNVHAFLKMKTPELLVCRCITSKYALSMFYCSI